MNSKSEHVFIVETLIDVPQTSTTSILVESKTVVINAKL